MQQQTKSATDSAENSHPLCHVVKTVAWYNTVTNKLINK